MKPCLNGGSCIAPDVCKCNGEFVGDQCEDEKCGSEPTILNSNPANCSTSNCQIKCESGFSFSDGTNLINFSCKNGQWTSNLTNPACERKNNEFNNP